MWYDDKTFVIRAEDPARLRDFLAAFGLAFVEEKHGDGPVHWACQGPDGRVLEVYPKAPKREAGR